MQTIVYVNRRAFTYAHASIWSVAVSVNCLSSLPAFAGCYMELNDLYWLLRSTNVFFKVSTHFYDESEFIVASLSPLTGQSRRGGGGGGGPPPYFPIHSLQ